LLFFAFFAVFSVFFYWYRQWRSQHKSLVGAKKFGGGQIFDFRCKTLFCLEKRLSKHKMTIFSKHFGGPWPLWPTPDYAYGYRHPRHPDRHYYLLTFYRVLASGPPAVASGLPSDNPPGSNL